jgi:hypothetical protein
MEKTKKINYTINDKAIVAALKDAPNGLTLADLVKVTGIELKPGHVVSAKNKGLIDTIGEVAVEKEGKRKVFTYNFVTADVLTKNDKPCNYTDGEKDILNTASKFDAAFTLADLANAMGVDKIAPGRITSLVRKGNMTKGDQVEVPTTVKDNVKVYGFVKDIPADVE